MPGFAQDAAEEADDDLIGIDEIVVTAERREQSLQDVAQTITAFSLEALTEQNIQDIYDLQLQVPSLVATGGLPAITLRGIGQDSEVLGPGIDPGFQLHINDIYAAQVAIALLDFHDLERVEVLPGPQGTLYGRNSTGGSINFHTKKADLEVHEISGDIEIGSYDKVRARGVVNVPIIDGELGVRIAWMQEYAAKPYESKGANGHDQNFASNALGGGTNLRFSMRWQPTEDITSDLLATWTRDNSGGGSSKFEGDYPDFTAPGTLFTGARNLNAARNPGNPKSLRSNVQTEQRYEALWLQWITSFELPQDLTLKINANYQYWDYFVNGDGDGSDVDAVTFILEDKNVTWSGEATIASNWDGPFNFIFGANYQTVDAPDTEVPFINKQDNQDLANYQVFNAFTLTADDPEVNRICDGPCIFQPAAGGHATFHPDGDTLTDTLGVFLNFNYDFTEELRFTGGLRYSYTDREFDDSGSRIDTFSEPLDIFTDGSLCELVFMVPPGLFDGPGCFGLFSALFLTPQTGVAATLDNTAFLIPVKGGLDATTLNTEAFERHKSWNSITWKARLEWRPADGQLFYGSVSTGERHGGFQFFGAPFDSEEIIAYEIGAKNAFLGGSMFLNTTVYYYDFKDRFIQQIENNVPEIQNVPESEVLGAEIQWIWQATQELRLNLNGGWLHTEITDDFVTQDNTVSAATGFINYCPGNTALGLGEFGSGPTCTGGLPQNIKGNSLPRAPEWSFSAGATYAMEFTQGVLTTRVNVSWRDEIDYRWFDNPLDKGNSYYRLDLRAHWEPHDSWWWAEVFVQNANNDEDVRTQLNGTTTGRGFWHAAPITWGLRLGYMFQDSDLPWVD